MTVDKIDHALFDPLRIKDSACLQESYRCFFLHLGVAIGLHPLAFEIAYRKHATMVIENSEPDDLCVEPAQSVLSRDEFVDCMALASLWPREFDEYQILIVNLDHQGHFNVHQGFTHIRPPIERYIDPETGNWSGKDIVLTLQGGHFTFLTPTGENIRRHPVDTMLRYARKGSFQIATPMEFLNPSFDDGDRVSLIQLLDKFLMQNE